MTQEHPITPPPELMRKWVGSQHGYLNAARWGADQELEACCEWFREEGWNECHPNNLRTARRPKPPSLKDNALLALSHLEKGAEPQMDATEAVYTIRRALESLPD